MKKEFRIIILAVIMTLMESGCGEGKNLYESSEKVESTMDSIESEEKTEKVSANNLVEAQVLDLVPYDIRFTFPGGWENTTDGTPYDLQMKNDDRYYCSIFGFKDIDLPNDTTPKDIFELQKEDIFAKRDFVELIKKVPVFEDENRIIYRELYSGENEGGKFYYYCCMIDFKEPEDGFAWIIFSGSPSWIENDMEDMDQILMMAERY